MIARNVRSGKFGAMVVSLTRGDTLFAQNAGEMMQPASTMKLFSTAVALDRFGPEHRFSTDVLRDGPVGADGTVNGNIYLRADGDPSMSARFYKDPNLPMATLARSVAAAGVKHVKGDLVVRRQRVRRPEDSRRLEDHVPRRRLRRPRVRALAQREPRLGRRAAERQDGRR